jgi:peroxiredoxin 2/4
MKKSILIPAVFFLFLTQVWSQNGKNNGIPLVGFDAPSFTALSTMGEINFPEDFGNYWKIIFAHPQDFTPVCSSELLELAYENGSFENIGVKLAVLSRDGLETHKLWKAALEEIAYKGRDPVQINFPLIADDSLDVAYKYGMVPFDDPIGTNIRSVFIIDPENKVRAVIHYPNEVGRNIEELKRLVVALQTSNGNVVTPANWNPGEDVMVRYITKEDIESLNKVNTSFYQYQWFMNFKKLD